MNRLYLTVFFLHWPSDMKNVVSFCKRDSWCRVTLVLTFYYFMILCRLPFPFSLKLWYWRSLSSFVLRSLWEFELFQSLRIWVFNLVLYRAYIKYVLIYLYSNLSDWYFIKHFWPVYLSFMLYAHYKEMITLPFFHHTFCVPRWLLSL